MFHILYGDEVLGKSALENGDPPMGCAEGLLIPFDPIAQFCASVPSEPDNDAVIRRWLGLSVATHDGTLIDCVDVVLFEYDFGDRKEFYVDVLGIYSDLYAALFPGHCAVYKARFAQKPDEA
jgi:hypothetical protein